MKEAIESKVREVCLQYRRLLNNAHFRRQAIDELEQFLEGLRSQGVVDDYSFAWIDGSMHCRWKLTGADSEHDVWEKVN
jgi:hypothetical protein